MGDGGKELSGVPECEEGLGFWSSEIISAS